MSVETQNTVKRPVGRPPLYTPELATELCKRIASCSHGIHVICAAEDMPSVTTVYEWLYEYPEFAERYARARTAQSEVLAQDIIRLSDEANLTHEHINKAKLQVDSRKWVASKLNPKKWGDGMVLRGDKDNPLDLGLAALLDAVASKRKEIPAIEAEYSVIEPMPAITSEAVQIDPMPPSGGGD